MCVVFLLLEILMQSLLWQSLSLQIYPYNCGPCLSMWAVFMETWRESFQWDTSFVFIKASPYSKIPHWFSIPMQKKKKITKNVVTYTRGDNVHRSELAEHSWRLYLGHIDLKSKSGKSAISYPHWGPFLSSFRLFSEFSLYRLENQWSVGNVSANRGCPWVIVICQSYKSEKSFLQDSKME